MNPVPLGFIHGYILWHMKQRDFHGFRNKYPTLMYGKSLYINMALLNCDLALNLFHPKNSIREMCGANCEPWWAGASSRKVDNAGHIHEIKPVNV